ncbi:protein TIFY 6b-like [Zingiber officinale]|uniref:protein TIFY 6b-like n=1 Tax=Zingiber officinale TaxID=94328 RepID=UPI001C4B8F61|nr:protein TIFY 6b-like [Zingiber officinale]
MERDFLGTHSKNFHPDPAALAGSPLQWPFSNKASAMQQFMLYKASQEEGPRSQALRPQHLPKAAAFELNHHALASQNFPGRHSIHGSFSSSSRHFTIPLAGNPYFKVQNAHYSAPNSAIKSTKKQPFVGGGVEVGSFGHRNMAKQKHKAAAQLTIFYGGCVNVFHDVPFDKAQAVMSSLANSGPNMASNGKKIRSEASRPISNSVSSKQSSARVVSPPSTASTGLKLVAHPSSVNQHQAIPRAIPQARKASLARFLEKRKERLTSAVPYASTKISTENNDWGHNASSSTSNSSADTNLSSYRMTSSFAGHLKNNSMDALSIKLKI